MIYFLCDRKILIGIGIGIIVGTSLMAAAKISYKMSDYEAESRARGLGMKYPDEINVIIDKGDKK